MILPELLQLLFSYKYNTTRTLLAKHGASFCTFLYPSHKQLESTQLASKEKPWKKSIHTKTCWAVCTEGSNAIIAKQVLTNGASEICCFTLMTVPLPTDSTGKKCWSIFIYFSIATHISTSIEVIVREASWRLRKVRMTQPLIPRNISIIKRNVGTKGHRTCQHHVGGRWRCEEIGAGDPRTDRHWSRRWYLKSRHAGWEGRRMRE